MPRNALTTTDAPQPKGGYSQVVVADRMIFTAGFGPHDSESGVVTASGIAQQTARTLDNVEAALRAAGASLDDVVKVTVHLQHLAEDFPEFDRVYRERFGEPYPVRTTVGSTLASILVEIDVVALRP